MDMNNDEYYHKYQKYKVKYLALKEIYGGNRENESSDNYLKGIKIMESFNVDITDEIKKVLMESLTDRLGANYSSFRERRRSKRKSKRRTSSSSDEEISFDNVLSNVEKTINEEIDKLKEVRSKPNDQCEKHQSQTWIKCTSTCQPTLKGIVDAEINSTAYILRTFAASVINSDDIPIEFKIDQRDRGKINGLWSNDSKYIRLIKYGTEKECVGSCDNGRLIMGFGPSASGKTYWAKNIIDLFRSINPSFPKSFISIDGGIYRETSIIYQMIKDRVIEKCFAGFSNLMSAGLGLTKSIFKASDIKKMFVTFLKGQKHIKINLYVPETLGGCVSRSRSCEKVYGKYIDITGDRESWIGLLIWQHKFGADCDFDETHQCVGCTESGTNREREEGKKYSNKAWEHSMEYGMSAILEAPGGSYKIHNSGGKKFNRKNCKSTLEDYSITPNRQLKEKEETYNYDYVVRTRETVN